MVLQSFVKKIRKIFFIPSVTIMTIPLALVAINANALMKVDTLVIDESRGLHILDRDIECKNLIFSGHTTLIAESDKRTVDEGRAEEEPYGIGIVAENTKFETGATLYLRSSLIITTQNAEGNLVRIENKRGLSNELKSPQSITLVGAKGKSGDHGAHGRNGREPGGIGGVHGEAGGSGSRGHDGQNGENGKNGNNGLQGLHAANFQFIAQQASSTLIFDINLNAGPGTKGGDGAEGGPGGNGGNGGSGGKGGDANSVHSASPGGNGGNGGNAGNGGHGGDGGNGGIGGTGGSIRLAVQLGNEPIKYMTSFAGGIGGQGGNGGKGGPAGKSGSAGYGGPGGKGWAMGLRKKKPAAAGGANGKIGSDGEPGKKGRDGNEGLSGKQDIQPFQAAYITPEQFNSIRYKSADQDECHYTFSKADGLINFEEEDGPCFYSMEKYKYKSY